MAKQSPPHKATREQARTEAELVGVGGLIMTAGRTEGSRLGTLHSEHLGVGGGRFCTW